MEPFFFISILAFSSSPIGISSEGIFGNENKISLSSFSIFSFFFSSFGILSFTSGASIFSSENSLLFSSDLTFPIIF